MVQANVAPPVADFVADQTLTCSGCVQFTDQSQNAPTSWLWNFGDNTTSTQQSPSHCYTAPGTYSVTLTATNAAGSNVRTRASYIVYDNAVPVAASCTPATTAFCCGYGVTQFTLGPLSKASQNGQAGYEDFTCGSRAQLTEGNSYAISLVHRHQPAGYPGVAGPQQRRGFHRQRAAVHGPEPHQSHRHGADSDHGRKERAAAPAGAGRLCGRRGHGLRRAAAGPDRGLYRDGARQHQPAGGRLQLPTTCPATARIRCSSPTKARTRPPAGSGTSATTPPAP